MPRVAGKAKRKKAAKPSKASTLKARTDLAEPTQRRTIYLSAPRTSGVRVTEDTALTLGAVFACLKVISEDIAGLPCGVFEKTRSGGSLAVPEDPADWLVGTQASPDTPAFQFREAIIAHAASWGNGYAEIERDLADRPAWLWLLTPDRVTPFREGSEIWYEVRNQTGGPTYIPSKDMFHVRGLGFDGLIGYSVIQLAARSIGAGIALDQSTGDIFANDSTPGGVLEHPGRLGEPARKRLVDDWERRHAGQYNRRKVAILEENMKWHQTGLPPEDTKLIEQRQFTPADICRWFRVSPVKIQDLLRATFSNIEELAIWHVSDTLLPWVRRFETECNIKLFGRTNRGKRFVRLNLNGLLRGNVAARGAFYQNMLDRGVFSINDVLSLEDRNPIGPDGDKRFVQVNMQLLEKAGEEPPPGAPVPPAAMAPESTSPPSTLRAALRPVFQDAVRRMLRREVDRTKAAKAGADVDDHAEYVKSVMRPIASALALSMNSDPAKLDAALDSVAHWRVLDFKARIAGGSEEGIESDAERFMDQLIAAVEATK